MNRRPLSRSLVPLDDESLAGFLLRLAKYTGCSPAVIADRMGLGQYYRAAMPVGSLLTLSSEQLAECAHVARLSHAEMEGLLLAPLGRRYGPLNHQLWPWSGPQQLTYLRRWVYLRNTQFCSRCLTSDNSVFGVLLGGSWKRRWHLAVSFACVEHRRLLKRNCPRCQHPAQAARWGIIEHAAEEDLHPTQCRASIHWKTSRKGGSICGTYLTDGPNNAPISSDPSTRNELLALQGRIDTLLSINGPDTAASCGQPVPVAQYFLDLRAVAALIFISWPQARPAAVTPTLARVIGGEATRRRQRASDTLRRAKSAPIGDIFLEPPTRPMATGAVLSTAEQLLNAACDSEGRAALAELYQQSEQARPTVSRRIADTPGLSPVLRGSFGLPVRRLGTRPRRRATAQEAR
ncbi:TniQ family protein [Streptomyces cellulosae]